MHYNFEREDYLQKSYSSRVINKKMPTNFIRPFICNFLHVVPGNCVSKLTASGSAPQNVKHWNKSTPPCEKHNLTAL